MAVINWNPGQVITLNPGDTAVCNGQLVNNQIYAVFLYNAAYHARSTDVFVVGKNTEDPITVTVPDSNANLGPAALCFVNGADTNSISAAILETSTNSLIQAFIGSISLPTEYTDGMQNLELPMTGQAQSFQRFTRFHATPPKNWCSLEIQSNIEQFMCVQFSEKQAKVHIVNKLQDPNEVIHYYGSASDNVVVNAVSSQKTSWTFQGSGQHFVWLNADSADAGNKASITLQSLQSIYDVLP